MKINILDRTLCSSYKLNLQESFYIAEGLINAGVTYIEAPSKDFVKAAKSFDGYIYSEEIEKLSPVYVMDLNELEQLANSIDTNQNVVIASTLTGYGFNRKHIPTELAMMYIGDSNNTDIIYDLIFDYIKPQLTRAWGYDGLCALAAEGRADEEYILYLYNKGLRATDIRKRLLSVDSERKVEFDITLAESLLTME